MARARTAKQRKALRKAQLASARKRKGQPNKRLADAHARSRRNAKIIVNTGLVATAVVGAAIATHKGSAYYKKNFYASKERFTGNNPAGITTRISPSTGAVRTTLSTGKVSIRGNNRFSITRDPEFAQAQRRARRRK